VVYHDIVKRLGTRYLDLGNEPPKALATEVLDLATAKRMGDRYPITQRAALDAERVSQYMIDWASRAIAEPAKLGSRRHVRISGRWDQQACTSRGSVELPVASGRTSGFIETRQRRLASRGLDEQRKVLCWQGVARMGFCSGAGWL
jgi:hypothetical protein